MSHLAAVFGASFIFVFLKALQQRHVAHNDWGFVLPTSLCMATVEYYVIITVSKQGYDWTLIVAGGTGAGLGALLAMVWHNYHLRRKAS